MARTFPAPVPVSAECERDNQWLEANMADLVRQHPDKWVAVLGEKVVAVGDTMSDVGRAVEAQYPNSEPVIWLLEGTIRVYSGLAPVQ